MLREGKHVQIVGVEIDNVSLTEAVDKIEQLASVKEFSFTVTPNVDHIVKSQKNASFRACYEKADLVVCDGVPLLWAARFLGSPLKGRVNGTDLFEKLVERAAVTGKSVFFLGGDEGVAQRAAEVLMRRYPQLNVCGCYCPPFGFEHDSAEDEKILQLLRAAKPTYLFVGVGAPKQEQWIANHAPIHGVRHAVGIGVSFSFVAGAIKRSPRWMQRSGLEWLWRLFAEPGRLWRRYLIDDPRFFLLVLRQKLDRRSSVC